MDEGTSNMRGKFGYDQVSCRNCILLITSSFLVWLLISMPFVEICHWLELSCVHCRFIVQNDVWVRATATSPYCDTELNVVDSFG